MEDAASVRERGKGMDEGGKGGRDEGHMGGRNWVKEREEGRSVGGKKEGKKGGTEGGRKRGQSGRRKRGRNWIKKGQKEFSGWEGGRIGYLCAALLLWQLIGIEWF